MCVCIYILRFADGTTGCLGFASHQSWWEGVWGWAGTKVLEVEESE